MKQQMETISYLDPGHGRCRQTESCPGSGQQAHDKYHETRRFVPKDRASLRCYQPAAHRDGIQLLQIATPTLQSDQPLSPQEGGWVQQSKLLVDLFNKLGIKDITKMIFSGVRCKLPLWSTNHSRFHEPKIVEGDQTPNMCFSQFKRCILLPFSLVMFHEPAPPLEMIICHHPDFPRNLRCKRFSPLSLKMCNFVFWKKKLNQIHKKIPQE